MNGDLLPDFDGDYCVLSADRKRIIHVHARYLEFGLYGMYVVLTHPIDSPDSNRWWAIIRASGDSSKKAMRNEVIQSLDDLEDGEYVTVLKP